MRSIDDLLEEAKWGKLTKEELSYVAQRIKSSTPNQQDEGLYSLIYTLGRANAVQYRALIETFLYYPTDPMISKIALQVLCLCWGYYTDYTHKIKNFIKGVEWDHDKDIYLIAVGYAGEVIRETTDNPDKELIQMLLNILLDNEQENAELWHECAYDALARAAGQEWSDILNDPNKPNPSIISKITEMLQNAKRTS